MHRRRASFVFLALAVGSSACSRKPEPPEARRVAPVDSALAVVPSSSAPQGAQHPGSPGAPTTPDGYVEMTVEGVSPTPAGEAVLLVDAGSKIGLPIFIGGTEALSIRLRLKKRDFVRPLTHDLYDATLSRLGANVQSARVDRLQDNTYFGTVVLTKDGKRLELDARPSDAIALAVGNRAPIHVAQAVLDVAGIKLDGRRGQELPVPSPDQRPDPITL